MAFTLVHTADWQIGKVFGRFEAEKAAVLRHARLEAATRIADLARSNGAGHVLVAGDVFDSETLPRTLVLQALQALAAQSGITWHLLPGNHDPARPGGVWDTVAVAGVPTNVRLHLRPEPAEIAPGIYVLPAPLAAKATSNDPTAWMATAPTPAHATRIGLAHGSVQGFGDEGDAAVYVDPAITRRAGLAYLALGDWHGTKRIAERIWYSGTPEPDGFGQSDPGNALVVRLDGTNVDVTSHAIAKFTWAERRIDISRDHAASAIETEVNALGARSFTHLLLLRLEGFLTLAEADASEARFDQLRARLFDLTLDRRGLSLQASASDVESIADPALRSVATRLQTMAESPGGEGPIALLALKRLMALSGSGSADQKP
ncbi:MAG: metallophosphoesterase [Hyphomicrobiaceae bacterium]